MELPHPSVLATAKTAILDTETTDNDLPEIPTMTRMLTHQTTLTQPDQLK